MNEVVVGGLAAISAGVVGYFGHVAQAANSRKHERHAEDVALMKDLHRKLVDLRDTDREPMEVETLASALETEVAMVRHAKLRSRVIEDLRSTHTLWMVQGRDGWPRKRQNVWIQDAVDALAAVARGERLPEQSQECETQLFLVARATQAMSAQLAPTMAAFFSSPHIVELREERARWEAERRAKRGWRRFILRRKPRSEVAAG
ncbi:hypothetical protein OG279_25140 [Streptomyces sp. NBC_01201]|uniref:hypothetical protein n=1 Tax=unclassified Streptomyces TaxID=2593676 RepID=UPI002E11CEE4|nr:hypothetical protein OG279_25140 [Streptomyces sp. NBC_01201]WSY34331.1 hypothetical protein OG844_33805 [Streptomyces sp. NBC_00887]